MKKRLITGAGVIAVIGAVAGTYFATTGQYFESAAAWCATAAILAICFLSV